MKSRSFFLAAALFAVAAAVHAQSFRVAVMDFALVSDNPQYKSLGKGFTELTSVQVAKLPGMTLVDRARRNDLLEEQAFAMSDAADAQKTVAIGKLLAVDYLVAGSVVDMLGELVVSYEVVKTDTGEIVGKDETSGAATEYKRMVRDIGAGIAKLTGKTAAAAVAAAKTPEKASIKEAPAEKQVTVLQNFSDAVEALDKKDVTTATAKLKEAKAIDPENEAVTVFLSKLAVGTSKFAVIPGIEYSLNHPANLALIKEDYAFMFVAMGSLNTPWTWDYAQPQTPLSKAYNSINYHVGEQDVRLMLGYATPIGKNMGLGFQGFCGKSGMTLHDPAVQYNWNALNLNAWPTGGVLSFGWSPFGWLSIGLGANAGYSIDGDPGTPDRGFPFYGGEAGFILKNASGSLTGSLLVGFSSLTTYEFDMDTITMGDKLPSPFHTDLTVTYGFNAFKDFLVLKYLADGNGLAKTPFLQVIPVWEHWFGTGLSLRLGGVMSFGPRSDGWVIGYGGSLGATLVFGKWEFDLGITQRNRPSRVIELEIVPETLFNISVRKNGIFTKRK